MPTHSERLFRRGYKLYPLLFDLHFSNKNRTIQEEPGVDFEDVNMDGLPALYASAQQGDIEALKKALFNPKSYVARRPHRRFLRNKVIHTETGGVQEAHITSVFHVGSSANRRSSAVSAILILLSVICFCDVFGDDDGTPAGAFVIDGTVRFTHLQGGCWYILAAGGGAYEPMNLSRSLKQDGLPVRLLVRGRHGMASICRIGRIVEILKVLEVGAAPSNSR